MRTTLGSALGATGNVNIIGQFCNVDTDQAASITKKREGRVLKEILPCAAKGYISGEAAITEGLMNRSHLLSPYAPYRTGAA